MKDKLSLTKEKTKKKGGISFEIDHSLNIWKLTIKKPKLSSELNISVLDTGQTKSRYSL
jgi:hypothetical protein